MLNLYFLYIIDIFRIQEMAYSGISKKNKTILKSNHFSLYLVWIVFLPTTLIP